MKGRVRCLLAYAAIGLLSLGGCRTFDPQHPASGPPNLSRQGAGYAVWYVDGTWHLAAISRGEPHRFQGSVSGLAGSIIELQPTRPELKDRVAVINGGVNFDLATAPRKRTQEISMRVAGGCARFDLYLDGRRRPERVHLGRRGLPARQIPFDYCL
jgi:hypothetical protein